MVQKLLSVRRAFGNAHGLMYGVLGNKKVAPRVKWHYFECQRRGFNPLTKAQPWANPRTVLALFTLTPANQPWQTGSLRRGSLLAGVIAVGLFLRTDETRTSTYQREERYGNPSVRLRDCVVS